MSIIKYIRLPFRFDAKRMQQEVKDIDLRHWQMHYQTLHYSGGWSALPLRSINGEAGNIFVSPLEDAVYRNTFFLQESPYFREIMAAFQCPLNGVRLMKLDAGAVIREHKDAELCYEKGGIRIHIPVVTHDDVEFFLDQERMQLKEGECWYMNFNLPHAVNNKSQVDRIHLVIDAVVNDWVRDLFSPAGSGGQPAVLKKEMEEPGYDERTKQQIIARLRELNTETANRMADEMSAGPGGEAGLLN